MAGRGASGNVVHRFTQQRIETVDDGWWQETASPSPATRISQVEARSIISHNRSPDVPFDASINPYQGCEHGCIYCYARPSHAYLELSPGLDFETRIFAKRNAPELLRAEFARPAYRPRVICIGANTDPYQPAEQRLRLTRELLKVMGDHGHPVTLITKSAMVLRDRDILAELAAEGLCRVMVSVTTLDETLRQRLEPRTTPGKGRLRVIEQLTRAGIPVGVLAAPMIPRLNEHELERILEGAAAAGAWKEPRRQEPTAPVISCCACPASSPPCSRHGSASTIRDDVRRCSPSCARAARGRSIARSLVNGCAGRGSLPTCSPSAFVWRCAVWDSTSPTCHCGSMPFVDPGSSSLSSNGPTRTQIVRPPSSVGMSSSPHSRHRRSRNILPLFASSPHGGRYRAASQPAVTA
nr:radical SAM protein [Aeromonas schubertii]